MPYREEKIKPIALVLPQFHPVPENSQWWGEGFTEWSNVVKAKPRFRGHYQPHLPRDLGFYDLRLPETREAQADLAKKFGIYGFCYYHYWFNGRRLLERPVDEILASGKPDFPFMLCWANENWSRNWDGGYNKVLLGQSYSVDDFVAHARHLVKYFKDPRYIKVDGRPVFAIYKDQEIENVDLCIKAFRRELINNGINVYLCRFERGLGTSADFERAFSVFDAGIEFQPLTRQFRRLDKAEGRKYPKYFYPSNYYRWIRKRFHLGLKPPDKIHRYTDVVNNDLAFDFQDGQPIFPGVCPGWDNSARRLKDTALILDQSTPEHFRRWVEGKIKVTDWSLVPERFLFVNAWNEWAEGNHLEPCERWGTAYLNELHKCIFD
ncbi:MAG: glycoside hydrolase family 99-like domain-containing protein [Pedobacter sp.]